MQSDLHALSVELSDVNTHLSELQGPWSACTMCRLIMAFAVLAGLLGDTAHFCNQYWERIFNV